MYTWHQPNNVKTNQYNQETCCLRLREESRMKVLKLRDVGTTDGKTLSIMVSARQKLTVAHNHKSWRKITTCNSKPRFAEGTSLEGSLAAKNISVKRERERMLLSCQIKLQVCSWHYLRLHNVLFIHNLIYFVAIFLRLNWFFFSFPDFFFAVFWFYCFFFIVLFFAF